MHTKHVRHQPSPTLQCLLHLDHRLWFLYSSEDTRLQELKNEALLQVSTPTCKDLESHHFSSHRKTENYFSFQFHHTIEITGQTSTLKIGDAREKRSQFTEN